MLVSYSPVITGIVGAIACLGITPLIIKLANFKGWVVYPRNDRWHKNPTALMGGVSIFAAFVIAIASSGIQNINWLILTPATLMFIIGLVDDVFEIKPVVKLLSQIVCSFLLIYSGYTFGGGLLGWAGIPLTFIWVIGITNAINLLDNMDGLAAGISSIVALISGILAILNGSYALASMAFAISGATFGFLFYNFKPARIFMGDSGSLFLGFSLSFLSVSVQNKLGSSSAILVLLVPISLMAIPIMDTTLVTVKRIIAGRRIDQGGRDHTSHRLVALGLSERKAVLTLYIISAVWGGACVLLFKTQINSLFLCLILLAVFSVTFSILLSKVKVYNEAEEELAYKRLRGRGQRSGNLMLRFFLQHKKLIIGLCVDILIIYSSFLIAAEVMRVDVERDYVVLATFICVKISLFYITNLYYRMWRYMDVLEAAGYFITIASSTIILTAIIFFKNKSQTYTLYFLMVDFLLTFTGIFFSRLFYRWMREQISRNRFSQQKVLIYGAGDSGYLLIKELLQNHRHELRPIGWIDDDESKHNMLLHGYKIFGGKEQLSEICKSRKVDIILISTDFITITVEEELRCSFEKEHISIGRFSIVFNYSKEPPKSQIR